MTESDSFPEPTGSSSVDSPEGSGADSPLVEDPAISAPEGSKRSLGVIATIVAAATLISKIFGLVRQQAIAAAFGTGAAFDAYSYAYVIPGFL